MSLLISHLNQFLQIYMSGVLNTATLHNTWLKNREGSCTYENVHNKNIDIDADTSN